MKLDTKYSGHQEWFFFFHKTKLWWWVEKVQDHAPSGFSEPQLFSFTRHVTKIIHSSKAAVVITETYFPVMHHLHWSLLFTTATSSLCSVTVNELNVAKFSLPFHFTCTGGNLCACFRVLPCECFALRAEKIIGGTFWSRRVSGNSEPGTSP